MKLRNKVFSTFFNNVPFFKAKALKQVPGETAESSMPVSSPPASKKLQPIDAKNLQQTDEILNSILPPRFI